MVLVYEYDFITGVIKLWYAHSIYICQADQRPIWFNILMQSIRFM